MPNGAAYGATKAALASLAQSWTAEYSPRGVRVNAVAAGPIYTRPEARQLFDRLGDTTALHRAAEPSEIAEVVAFLASPRASYITGAIVAADGGRTRSNPTPPSSRGYPPWPSRPSPDQHLRRRDRPPRTLRADGLDQPAKPGAADDFTALATGDGLRLILNQVPATISHTQRHRRPRDRRYAASTPTPCRDPRSPGAR